MDKKMQKKKSKKEIQKKINSFVSDGFNIIKDMEKKIVNIDSVNNREVINIIFRMLHALKGKAGYLNFENIKKVTHEVEALINVFRNQYIKPNQQTIDLLYQTLDFLNELLFYLQFLSSSSRIHLEFLDLIFSDLASQTSYVISIKYVLLLFLILFYMSDKRLLIQFL